MSRFVFLFLLFVALVGSPQAQQQFGVAKEDLHPCGVSERSAWLDAYQRGEIAAVRSAMPLTMPIQLHIVGRSDGSGTTPWSRIISAFQLLNEDFASAEINFCIEGEINYINNNNFYEHTFSSGGTMMGLNNRPNKINVYFVGDPAGACGYYSPSRDALAVANNCLGSGDHTFAHEMGHFLSLPHTFDGWEGVDIDDLPIDSPAPFSQGGRQVEKADSSNCATAGDGFCDTPADYIADRWPCNSAGMYADSLLDPDSIKFAVPAYNIMSYALDNCVTNFTDEQRDAMVANANSRGNLQLDPNPNPSAPSAADMQLLSPENGDIEAIDELAVQLNWTAVEGADFYLVQINRTPFFGSVLHQEIVVYDTSVVLTATNSIDLGVRYYWRILPQSNCALDISASGSRNFRITDIVSATIDPALDAALRVFPNPAKAGEQTLNIRARHLTNNSPAQLELFQLDGKLLLEAKDISTSAGQLHYELPVQQLATGVYFLRLRQGGRMVNRRVVITQ